MEDAVTVGLDGRVGDDRGSVDRCGQRSSSYGGDRGGDGWCSGVAGDHWGGRVDDGVAVGLNGLGADDRCAGLDGWDHSCGGKETGLGRHYGCQSEESYLELKEKFFSKRIQKFMFYKCTA